jgi:septal ring factor EnvC (AmiA/AmiB activator)
MAAAEEPPPEDFDAFFDAEAEPDAEAAYTFELADVVETLQLVRGIENIVTTIDDTTVSTRDRVTDLAYLVKTLQEQLEGIDGNVSMLKAQNVVLSVEHHNLHRAVAVLSEEARKLHRAVMALVRRAEGQSAEGQSAEGQSAEGQKESPNPHNF